MAICPDFAVHEILQLFDRSVADQKVLDIVGRRPVGHPAAADAS
jgi:hypothetical protein